MNFPLEHRPEEHNHVKNRRIIKKALSYRFRGGKTGLGQNRTIVGSIEGIFLRDILRGQFRTLFMGNYQQPPILVSIR